MRTLHLVSMALLTGGVAVGLSVEQLTLGLWGTLGSGLLFLLFEMCHSCIYLVQLKGVVVLAKMLLMAGALAFPGASLPLFVLAIVTGGIGSHMPARFRHYSLLHGREIKGSAR